MRAHAALLGLVFASVPAAAAARQDPPAPASRPATGAGAARDRRDVEVVRDAARRLHEERRYAEAAALLERLAAEAGRDDLLFDAGQSRFAAGHRAHALRLWQAYAAAPGRSAEDIALAARRIADARALTAAITFIVHVPENMCTWTLTARRLHEPPDAARPPIVVDLPAGDGDARTIELALDPGVWAVLVAPTAGRTGAPADPAAARRELVVGRDPQTVELAPPAPPPASDAPGRSAERDDDPARPRLGAALLSLAGASLAAGTAVTLVGARGFRTARGACEAELFAGDCSESRILARVHQTGAAAGLLGAGIGLLVTGASALAPRSSRRLWIIEAAAGGAALLAGAVWLAVEDAGYRAVAPSNALYLERLGPRFDRRAGAAALLGAGTGLGLGAAAGLLPWPRGEGRTTSRPALGLSGAGLVLAF